MNFVPVLNPEAPVFIAQAAQVSALPTVESGSTVVGTEHMVSVPAGAYVEIGGNPRDLEISLDGGTTYFPVRRGDVLPTNNGKLYLARTASTSGQGEGSYRLIVWRSASAGLRAAAGRQQSAGVVPNYGTSIGGDAEVCTISAGVASSFVIGTSGVYLLTVTGAAVTRESGGVLPDGYAGHEFLAAGTYIFDTLDAADTATVSATRVSSWREVAP